jgi:magnesium-transporting ATPase (P-type)
MINHEDLRETDSFLRRASVKGLRTLLFSMKILEHDEVKQFLDDCKEAESDVKTRNEKLEEIYDNLENGLYMIGATVVEDKLQDGVPDTIQSLHEANIKVWMLTGDKLETAESIGYSTRLLTPQMDLIRVATP